MLRYGIGDLRLNFENDLRFLAQFGEVGVILSENWLREWVNPDLDAEALAHTLTMAGLGGCSNATGRWSRWRGCGGDRFC